MNNVINRLFTILWLLVGVQLGAYTTSTVYFDYLASEVAYEDLSQLYDEIKALNAKLEEPPGAFESTDAYQKRIALYEQKRDAVLSVDYEVLFEDLNVAVDFQSDTLTVKIVSPFIALDGMSDDYNKEIRSVFILSDDKLRGISLFKESLKMICQVRFDKNCRMQIRKKTTTYNNKILK